jgi:hypothetical protein
MFAPVRAKPRLAVKCDSVRLLITEVEEVGRRVALAIPIFPLASLALKMAT